MRINLTTPMSDDKERQRRTKAEIDAIERYTEERMNDEYGKIHTDGSRSGGQPVLLPCPFCGGEPKWYEGKFCASVKCDNGHAIHEYKPTLIEAIAAWNTRQPTQSDALRDLVATLWCASGCSCCRDDDAWEKASHELAELLGIPKYDDGSGYDWYSVCDAAKGQSK